MLHGVEYPIKHKNFDLLVSAFTDDTVLTVAVAKLNQYVTQPPHWFMLNNQIVDILAEMCKACLEFRHG